MFIELVKTETVTLSWTEAEIDLSLSIVTEERDLVAGSVLWVEPGEDGDWHPGSALACTWSGARIELPAGSWRPAALTAAAAS